MNRKLAQTIKVGDKVTFTWRNNRFQDWTTTEYIVTEITPAEQTPNPARGREFQLKTAAEIAEGRLTGIRIAERSKDSVRLAAA
jgi:hypothetical protein